MPLKGFGTSGTLFNIITEVLQQASQEHERQRERERERERERQRQEQAAAQAQAQGHRVLLRQRRRSRSRSPKKLDVVVVGCGASGIAALSRLAKAGINAIGLEASSRMGGRIRTVKFGRNVVDLGAAWCHGEEGNIVYELAKPHNLLGTPDENGDLWYIYSDGTLMPTGNGSSLVNSITKAVERAPKNNITSISEFVRNGVSNGDIKTEPAALPMPEYILEWYERDNHLCGQTDPTSGKSLKGLVKHEICLGEFWLHWKGKGYKTILDVLLGKEPSTATPIDVNIIYNAEVTNLSWMLVTDEENPRPYVKVTCANGLTYDASNVIVTTSLGVLKERSSSLFIPPLPASKINAITNLGFCLLDKIYIEFSRPWWPQSPANFRLLWRDDDKINLSQDEKWITGVHGLMTLENQPNVLLAWIYGEDARVMEGVSKDAIKAGVNKLMDIFRVNFDVTEVTSVLRSQWATDPLFRGSYSYRSVATEATGTGAEDLAEPLYNLGKPVLCFAGEATSHKHFNSVHGAIEAGFREANRVKNSIQGMP